MSIKFSFSLGYKAGQSVPYRPLTTYIFAPQVGLILPPVTHRGTQISREKEENKVTLDDTLPQQKTPASPERHLVCVSSLTYSI
jgi:hypothetical protein